MSSRTIVVHTVHAVTVVCRVARDKAQQLNVIQ